MDETHWKCCGRNNQTKLLKIIDWKEFRLGCPFARDGSRRHRTHRGSGQNRRCSRVGSRYETIHSLRPATPYRGEQVEVAPGEFAIAIWLERIGVHLSSIHVHGEEVDVVVLGVKRILGERTVVHVVIDAGYR